MIKMAEGLGRAVDGLFAIQKPSYISSAQVIRDLQNHFGSSRVFAPQLAHQVQRAESLGGGKRQKRKRLDEARKVKIGHGGTLDPLATGVLVLGLGKGTKHLSDFLHCTKTYETVVLFGKGTETYDLGGSVVASAKYEHVTRASVEQELASFRGNIKQVPPIYSALKINGIKAYDYARTGRELPRALEAREMEVQECQLLEWFGGGQHEYRWPINEASSEVKAAAQSLMPLTQEENQDAANSPKRKLSDLVHMEPAESAEAQAKKHQSSETAKPADAPAGAPGPLASDSINNSNNNNNMPEAGKAKFHTHEPGQLSSEICPAPAARIRLTVSSGFYVRSFAHDLGMACGSLALMSSLFRSRQGAFDAPSALTYQDLADGEEVWGPKLQRMLHDWNEQRPGDSSQDDVNRSRRDSGSRDGPPATEKRARSRQHKGDAKRRARDQGRRNTSSDEE